MEAEKASNLNQFENTIQAGVALVDFGAPWCAPCRAQKPIIEQLSKQFDGKAQIVEVNVDENRDLAMHLDIMSIPTLILFIEGKEVQRFVGLQSIEVLSEAVENVLV